MQSLNTAISNIFKTSFFLTLLAFSFIGCDSDQVETSYVETITNEAYVRPEPISPIAIDSSLSSEMIALGRKLFHEKGLSATNKIACSSCHDLKKGGDDGKQFSEGIDQNMGRINTPTVFNSSLIKNLTS